MGALSQNNPNRVDWVDYGKGFCIIFVVMMHSTLGVGAAAHAEGWMHHVVAFAKPFRMPDFFLIAGLFLATRVNKPWRDYLDTKVVHFLYFYWLWVIIQVAFKAPKLFDSWTEIPGALAYYAVQPFGTLWFIYMLPVFFVVTKLTRSLPAGFIWGLAVAAEAADIHTGWVLVDEFAARFVYFYTGYVAAPFIFKLARHVQAAPMAAIAALIAWAVTNGNAVFGGYSEWPVVSLILGYAGAGAIVAISALLAKWGRAVWLEYLGQNSIVVYLAFFAPMIISREILLRTGIITDIGTISLLVTAAGIIGPVIFYMMFGKTWLKFLFKRPAWAHLKPSIPAHTVPAT